MPVPPCCKENMSALSQSTRGFIRRPARVIAAAAVASALAVNPVQVPVANAQSSLSSLFGGSSALSSNGSSGSSRQDSGTNKPPQPPSDWATAISDGLAVKMIGDVLGLAKSLGLGLGVGDLGIMAPIGTNTGGQDTAGGISEGEEFAIIFGDSFTGNGFGQGQWLSPVGMVATMRGGEIVLERPLNSGDEVEQLINYRHEDRLTLLPSDVININGTLYLQAMWNRGLGNVISTQIWSSTDDGRTWQSEESVPAQYMGGMGQLISWEQGPDGYIYMVSTGFQRADDVYLTRFLPGDIDYYPAWEHYSNGRWSSSYSPILSTKVRAGEMSLRYIQGYWVLSMFNEQTASIEVRISKDIARNWNEIKPATVVIAGQGGWAAEQSPENFTQLYGGYITPGSTLDNLSIVVSQWNTSNNSRYNSTQFTVSGLDSFYGIEVGGGERAASASESDLTVTATDAVDESVESAALESVAEAQVAPLDEN